MARHPTSPDTATGITSHDHEDAMTDQTSAADGELGAKPEPVIEPAEPNPGGADALPGPGDDEVVGADLPVELNPAVDEVAHPDLAQGEDTSTAATRDEDPDDTAEAPV